MAQFECCVCMEELSATEEPKQPRFLTCGHSFCFGCLCTLVKDNRIRCPNCRDVTQLSDGASGLKKNFSLIEALQVLEEIHKKGGVECSECDVLTDTVCLMCPDRPVLCSECFSITHATPKRKSHQLSSRKERQPASKKTEAAKVLGVATIGGVAGVGATAGAQVAARAAIPSLMSAGATVVSGVGSIMPWWIGPIQAFSVCKTPIVVPVVVGGGVALAGYGTYKYFNSTSQADEEKQK